MALRPTSTIILEVTSTLNPNDTADILNVLWILTFLTFLLFTEGTKTLEHTRTLHPLDPHLSSCQSLLGHVEASNVVRYVVSHASPYLHVAIIVQSPAPTFTLLLLCNHQPYLHVAIIVQSPAPTFTLLILHNHQPYLHIAIIVQSPDPTFTLLILHNHQTLPSRC